MATGWNTVTTFSDSLDDIRDAARTTREYANRMARLVDTRRLENNTGTAWQENLLAQLNAGGISETTDLEQNPQQIVDSLFSVTPTLVGMSVFTTDLAKIRITKEVAMRLGRLTEDAMARKKEIDLLAVGASATTDLGTAGNPMASDLISAAVSRTRGNATEPWDGPVHSVMTTFQLKDIQDEGVSGFGTYPIDKGGLTETFLRKGYHGDLFGSSMNTADNISVDGSDDAIAMTFAGGPEGAVVLVEGMESRRVTERKEGIGAGAEILYATDQYGIGIRQQAWIYAITADSASPSG